jgi:hypothetical protein
MGIRNRRRCRGVIPGLTVLLAVALGPAAAQQPTLPTLARAAALGKAPAQVMVLGVFHFHNPNADYAQFRGIDVLTPERQREIDGVVRGLAAFAPTRIAVEHPPETADSLNARYRRYRAGAFPLGASETHQLGYRLAARLGHEALYPVDFRLGMRMDSLFAYAQARDTALLPRFNAYIGEIVRLLDAMQAERPIAETLRFMNEPRHIDPTHEPYVVQATVGAGDGYIGARVVTDWYERNLRIFANLAAVAQPGERVLLIIGAGHTPILRDLVRVHPDMELVEAVDYLPPAVLPR